MTHDADNRPLGHSVADALARERRAEEARMLPESGPLNEEQLAYARRQVAAFIAAKELTLKQVARELGRGESTLNQFINDKYPGDEDKLARELVRWMRAREEGHRAGMPTGFVSTKIAERMLGVIHGVYRTGTMGAILGPSGISKTVVCRAAEAMFPGAVYCELTSAQRTPGSILRMLADIHKIRGRSKSQDVVLAALIESLKGSNRVHLVDEAHMLSKPGLLILRDIHKQAGLPMVFVGTRDFFDVINDFTEFHGQISRLFSFTYNVTEECADSGNPLYTVDEVIRFAKSMQLRLAGDAAEFITELCNIPGWGGLGKASMLLLTAKVLAGVDPGRIELKHVQSALRQMAGATGFQQTTLKLSRKVKVA